MQILFDLTKQDIALTNVLLFLIGSFGLSSWEWYIFIIISLYSFTLMTVFLSWANHVGLKFFVCYVAGSILSKDSASEQNLKVMQEKSVILKVIFTFSRVPLFHSLSRFNIFCPNYGKFIDKDNRPKVRKYKWKVLNLVSVCPLSSYLEKMLQIIFVEVF